MALDGKKGTSLKTKCLWLAVFLAAAAFALSLYRDLSLEIPLPSSPEGGESHMEIQEIDLERVFDGDRWHVTAPLTVREGEETVIRSADIRVLTASGDHWSLLSPKARFDEEMNEGLLESPRGTVEGSGYEYRWRAGKADWEGKRRLWHLSGGFTLEGETYIMRARSGVLFPDGRVRFEEEVAVRWRTDVLND